MKYCTNCGAQNEDAARFCGSCAVPFGQTGGARPTVTLTLQPIVVAFGLGAIVLLVLLVASLVSDERSDNARLLASITASLLSLYLFSVCVYGAYRTVEQLDFGKLFRTTAWWLKALSIAVLASWLYVPLTFVVNRLLALVSRSSLVVAFQLGQLLTSSSSNTTFLIEQTIEGFMLVAIAAAVIYVVRK